MSLVSRSAFFRIIIFFVLVLLLAPIAHAQLEPFAGERELHVDRPGASLVGVHGVAQQIDQHFEQRAGVAGEIGGLDAGIEVQRDATLVAGCLPDKARVSVPMLSWRTVLSTVSRRHVETELGFRGERGAVSSQTLRAAASIRFGWRVPASFCRPIRHPPRDSCFRPRPCRRTRPSSSTRRDRRIPTARSSHMPGTSATATRPPPPIPAIPMRPQAPTTSR